MSTSLVFIEFRFDPGLMARNHRGPSSDHLIIARISGIAMHLASWQEPAEDEMTAAVPSSARWPATGRTCWPTR